MKSLSRLSAAAVVAAFSLSIASVPSDAYSAPAASSKKAQKKKVKVLNNPHCPVMNARNGAMGAASSTIYKGYKVSLCCDACINKFYEYPDAYLQAAIADAKRR